MSFFNRFFHRDEQKEVVPPAEQPEVLPIDREIDALYQALIDPSARIRSSYRPAA